MKHYAEITLPVEIVFDLLDPLEVEGGMLPSQIDIREVLLEITGPAGKARKVDITKGIAESQLMLWEDEILDGEDNDHDQDSAQ